MRNLTPLFLALATAVTISACNSQVAITKADVKEAQDAWAKGIVAIGQTFIDEGDYQARASEHIDTLYNYDRGDVLFKPTQASENQFRNTKEDALSYFVGGKFSEDGGFAIKPWTQVRFENVGVITQGSEAVAMGNYFFTDLEGVQTKVEYSFGYVKHEDGAVKINLHHSSLPY